MSWLHLCTLNTITHNDEPSDTPPRVQRTIKALFRISLRIDSWVLFSIFTGVQMLSTFPLKVLRSKKKSSEIKKENCFKKTCQCCYLVGRHKQTYAVLKQNIRMCFSCCVTAVMINCDSILISHRNIWSFTVVCQTTISQTKKHIKNVTLPTVYTNVAAIIE